MTNPSPPASTAEHIRQNGEPEQAFVAFRLTHLSDRDLVERAEHYATLAHAQDDPASMQIAREGLAAAHHEAERRATDQPAGSTAAEVAGYVSLLAEDHDRALVAEADAWRADLEHALPRQRANGPDLCDIAEPEMSPEAVARHRVDLAVTRQAASALDPERTQSVLQGRYDGRGDDSGLATDDGDVR